MNFLGDILGRAAWVVLGCLLCQLGLAYGFVLFVPTSGFLQLFVVTYGICTAALDVVVPLALADCFGSKHLAEIYGVLTLTLLFPGGSSGPSSPGPSRIASGATTSRSRASAS